MDLTSRYTYLASKAFDYETGLLDTTQGKRFISRIVSSRALGVVDDDGAPLGKFGHVFEVNRGVGRLSGHDDELASFLHRDDGGAGDEVVGNARSQLADGGARARADDDGVDFGRAGGGFGSDVFGVLEHSVGGLTARNYV